MSEDCFLLKILVSFLCVIPSLQYHSRYRSGGYNNNGYNENGGIFTGIDDPWAIALICVIVAAIIIAIAVYVIRCLKRARRREDEVRQHDRQTGVLRPMMSGNNPSNVNGYSRVIGGTDEPKSEWTALASNEEFNCHQNQSKNQANRY